ncbi:MAG: putative flippase GtrA [Motiliproteus sp.]|jgi:putative flippase GtrA
MVEAMRQLVNQSAFRYLLTGGGLFCIDLLCFLLCLELLGLSVAMAQVISRSVGALVGFFGHKYFSFKNNTSADSSVSRLSLQSLGYFIVTFVNIMLSPFVVSYCMDLFRDNILIAKIVAEVFLVLETYLLLRLVFTPRRGR